ncbi:hypothetical protein [Streptomyces sp. AD55]|uniref:hypothetical protein n=1 Tax=Streptomyces sp. AD55 TaxID=3242895 RepID=UPI0035281D7E
MSRAHLPHAVADQVVEGVRGCLTSTTGTTTTAYDHDAEGNRIKKGAGTYTSRGNGRAGRHRWVSADDRARWQELIGEKAPLPTAPAEDEDDVITFAGQEIDRTCRAGEGCLVRQRRPTPS